MARERSEDSCMTCCCDPSSGFDDGEQDGDGDSDARDGEDGDDDNDDNWEEYETRMTMTMMKR